MEIRRKHRKKKTEADAWAYKRIPQHPYSLSTRGTTSITHKISDTLITMARSFVVVALVVSVLCFSSSALARKTPEKFFVEGKIYCDPRHFEFESRLSFSLSGVKVSLQCIKEERDTVVYQKNSTTDANGMYSIPVDGDHEREICVVVADSPTEGQCKEAMPNKSNRITLTDNMGVASLARYVNPLGFMTQTIDPQCNFVVQELGLDNLDD